MGVEWEAVEMLLQLPGAEPTEQHVVEAMRLARSVRDRPTEALRAGVRFLRGREWTFQRIQDETGVDDATAWRLAQEPR